MSESEWIDLYRYQVKKILPTTSIIRLKVAGNIQAATEIPDTDEEPGTDDESLLEKNLANSNDVDHDDADALVNDSDKTNSTDEEDPEWQDVL
ncbi:hypothetical protein L596_016490 [Steinernema carpocapsae]|uniref:Uncharacterized protein n=1 Tax=Steinernema carpocapsae TaxID=34508 RepID=A0A4U5NJ62_STECR|nr:hypothetical protein L596_016490 [Steinernema carpocapsae]